METLEGYEVRNADLLKDVLDAALQQVVSGKGMERHGGEDLLNQPWRWISDATGEGFLLGQAMKKTQEAAKMPADRFEREILGAIAYLGFAVLKRRLDNAIHVHAVSSQTITWPPSS